MDEEVGMWLEQSEEDYKSAEVLLTARKYYAAAFFSQQAAEKTLKAVYIKKFKELIKIHDLYFLAKKLDAPSEILDNCKFLNKAYIESRYPSDIGIPARNFSSDDAKTAIKLAKEVIEWAKKNL